MPKSIRIRTEPGVDKDINIRIDQDFDSLEILSLKLRQEDLYTQFCADYGVVVGRVIANGGFGVPNAHISIFVPIDQIDENDPVISTLYPYKTPEGKNEDGYRYNLLPYRDEYYGHNATGTFPDIEDVLTRKEVLHVYDKYYKYSVRTNDSGDFMIVGVPLGAQKLVMDLDLSNMGEFSLRPSDLIRMGMGVPSQFNGQLFKDSENIDSLPQIVHEVKDIDVSSFWGASETCDVGITRADFDLREQGIEITPHCVFMGSIMSSSEDDYLKANCRPKKDVGNLCDLTAGPGQVLAIRQTILEDVNGDPVLEEYKLEDGGNIIDDNGAWLTEMPMNLDYVITNEFGERVNSPDPTIGIPTKSKYRFKIKWMNEGGLDDSIMRANYLIPNVKEHWNTLPITPDGGTYSTLSEDSFNKSYSFSLDWNDYFDKSAAIKCEDTFYQFNYNKVYTVASHIDRFKWGFNRASHLGIKEITDKACQSENNRFPINEAIRNFDFINFIVQLLLTILSPIIYILIIVAHIAAFIYEIVRWLLNKIIIPITNFLYGKICKVVAFLSKKLDKSDCNKEPIGELGPFPASNLPLPMMSYPDCEACPCTNTENPDDGNDYTDSQTFAQDTKNSILASFTELIPWDAGETCKTENPEFYDLSYSYALGGWRPNTINDTLDSRKNDIWYKTPLYFNTNGNIFNKNNFRATNTISLAQSLNLINQRSRYFDTNTPNIIRTQIVNSQLPSATYNTPALGVNQFEDLPLIMVLESGNQYNPGQLLTFEDLNGINDPNVTGATLNQYGTQSITGTVLHNSTAYIPSTISYQPPNGGNPQSVNLQLYNEVILEQDYRFESGVEYFQVISATTMGNIIDTITGSTAPYTTKSILWKYLIGKITLFNCGHDLFTGINNLNTLEQYTNYRNLVMVIMNRGVDPHSPKQEIRYDLSKLFGQNYGTSTVSGEYYLNVPIQHNGGNSICSGSNSWREDVKTPSPHFCRSSGGDWISNTNNSSNMSPLFHNSFLYKVDETKFTGFTTSAIKRYSSIDKSIIGLPASDGVVTNSNNKFLIDASTNQGRIEGSTYQYVDQTYHGIINGSPSVFTVSTTYGDLSPNPTTTLIDVNSSTNQPIVFRSDRLPRSSGEDKGYVPTFTSIQNFVFHLNEDFKIFEISDDGGQTQPAGQTSIATDGSSAGQDMLDGGINPQLSGVLDSFTCNGMVPLNCYDGEGITFGINTSNPDCNDEDMTGGCYFLVKPKYIKTIPKDIKNFTEWKARFRYVFAACRGVFGQVFQNNWVNGNLYMPSFQKRTFFDGNNQVRRYKFCGDPGQSKFGMFFSNREFKGPIYFNTDSNSFYYRSTPYHNGQFKGLNLDTSYDGANDRQLFFPTTIMDLGPKTDFLKEIMLSPEFESYVMSELKSTSYQDMSGILNLFIISRLVNRGFLEKLFNLGDDTVSASFSRQGGFANRFTDARMDADYVQMVSINSELGVIPYIDNNYADDIFVGSVGGDALMGIWFTANTENRKIIGPGITQFSPTLSNKFGYPNSQMVPSYRWNVNNTSNLFGNQENGWDTTGNGTIEVNYQNDTLGTGGDYPKSPSFEGTGYLYSDNDDVSIIPTNNPKYRVGSPFYFYFGLKRGKSAMNKFITKYLTIVG